MVCSLCVAVCVGLPMVSENVLFNWCKPQPANCKPQFIAPVPDPLLELDGNYSPTNGFHQRKILESRTYIDPVVTRLPQADAFV